MIPSTMGHHGAAHSCNFCKWWANLQHDSSKDDDWMIWITEGLEFDKKLGFDIKFKVYVQNRTRNTGYHATWKACGRHAWDAYVEMQEVMLEELAHWEVTEKWLSRRNSRI